MVELTILPMDKFNIPSLVYNITFYDIIQYISYTFQDKIEAF